MVEGELTLVLGGTRSGKSAVAERLAAGCGLPVTYVATGPPDDGTDPEWRARVAAHRARRPAAWTTVEVPPGGDLGGLVARVEGTALVEALGTWLAGFEGFAAPVGELCDALASRARAGLPTVVVSEEVGLGVHPETAVGRAFRDVLGDCNQAVAAVAGRALLVVAGRALELRGGRPVSHARRALAFLTPLGGAAVPSPGALGWFPAVGAAIGAVLGVAWWGLEHAWPPAVAASIVVALDLALTGLLHFDGVVDAADGLLAHLDRERRLAVMREPTVGAFGLAAGAAVLLARWSALFALRPSVLLLVALWTASRTVMAVAATACPYAGGGLATAFLGAPAAGVVAGLVGVPAAVAAAVVWRPLAGGIALAAGALGAALVVVLALRRLGGFTGDVLGAAGVTLETVGLVVAAARW